MAIKSNQVKQPDYGKLGTGHVAPSNGQGGVISHPHKTASQGHSTHDKILKSGGLKPQVVKHAVEDKRSQRRPRKLTNKTFNTTSENFIGSQQK